MKILNKKISDLKVYERNARKHPRDQIDLLARNIEKFGFTTPILIDEHDVIIAGHGRLMALQQLKRTEAPCVLISGLTPEEVRALRLADNRIASMGEDDMKLVIDELRELTLPMLELTGFSKDLLLDNDDKDDQVGGLPAVGMTKVGEVWHLGPHKLMVGDATNKDHVEALMHGVKADMIFTDPPYNVDYSGSAKKSATKKILNDNLGDSEFESLLTKSFENYRQYIKEGGAAYIFHSPTTQAVFQRALEANGFEVKYQLIWNKPSAGLGMGDYRAKHEPFFYAGIKGHRIQFYGDHTNISVWDFTKSDEDLLKLIKRAKRADMEGKSTIWTMKREPTGDYVHPTQKPVELITYALVNSSKAGDTVIDLFAGSGATIIACEKAKRHAYCMELDPRYADVILDRYADYTGFEPIRESDSLAWSELSGKNVSKKEVKPRGKKSKKQMEEEEEAFDD